MERLVPEQKGKLYWSVFVRTRVTNVEIVLLAHGRANQTLKLSVSHDFDWNLRTAEWRAKVPIMLDDRDHADHASPHW